MILPKLEVPKSLTYAAFFLTLKCNLACTYCLNDPKQEGIRNELFPITDDHIGLTPDQWVLALNRLPKQEHLPMTLCGGEVTIYDKGNGANKIIDGCDHYFDILTNMASMKFFKNLGRHNVWKLQRPSSYPSIRVSWHEEEMVRTWKNGFKELVKRCEQISEYGLDVSPDMTKSDIVIQMVAHPNNHTPDKSLWVDKVPFETKDFLGIHEGQLYGHYAYEHATSLVELGIHNKPLHCKCLTRELIVDQAGFIHMCHKFLYDAWAGRNLKVEFDKLKYYDFRFVLFGDEIFKNSDIKPIGHILDKDLDLSILSTPKDCYSYGQCSFCDVKSKRPHVGDTTVKYSSVVITDIDWPSEFKPRKTSPIKQL